MKYISSQAAALTKHNCYFTKMFMIDPEFIILSDEDVFVYLMANRNQTVITLFANFI